MNPAFVRGPADLQIVARLLANYDTRLLRIPFIADFFIGRAVRDDIELPDYEF